MTSAPSPTSRRISRPRWLDPRVLGGLLLIIVSVAVGAKVVGSASRTSPVWAAAADLAAGTVLASGDLVPVDVNLGQHGATYIDSSSALAGAVLNRPVNRGELIPAAALGEPDDGRIVSIAVTPEHVAPGVGHGSVIDLYLVTGRSAVIGEEVTTELVQSAVTVQDVIAPATGGLSGAVSSRYQVALLLAPAEADALVRRLPQGEPLIVLRTGGAADADGPSGVADADGPSGVADDVDEGP